MKVAPALESDYDSAARIAPAVSSEEPGGNNRAGQPQAEPGSRIAWSISSPRILEDRIDPESGSSRAADATDATVPVRSASTPLPPLITGLKPRSHQASSAFDINHDGKVDMCDFCAAIALSVSATCFAFDQYLAGFPYIATPATAAAWVSGLALQT